ncbi:MAG: hypothetical protein M3P34_03055 [Actinomycetota bacterium]|nr:hypothetical protein [Actinomycetota bacterium]
MSLAWYDELREQYRPERVSVLLVGESPPDPGAGAPRFFYAPTLSRDNLYRGVAAAFYGAEPGFDVRDKPHVLRRLQRDGVWLIDAVEHPINMQSAAARQRAIAAASPSLAKRALELAPTVGVLVCHGVVFTAAAPALRSAGVRVLHDSRLPFPLGNWRAEFVAQVRAALEAAGWQGQP